MNSSISVEMIIVIIVGILALLAIVSMILKTPKPDDKVQQLFTDCAQLDMAERRRRYIEKCIALEPDRNTRIELNETLDELNAEIRLLESKIKQQK